MCGLWGPGEMAQSVSTSRIALGISFALVAAGLSTLGPYVAGSESTEDVGRGVTSFRFKRTVQVGNGVEQRLPNHQVQITFDTAQEIFSGHMKPDCSDLRFTTVNASRTLDHWIEPGTCNSETTPIWVRVPSIPSPSPGPERNLTMWYGEAAQTDTATKDGTLDHIEIGRTSLCDTIDGACADPTKDVSQSVELTGSISDPAIAAYIPTRNGGHQVDVRAQNVDPHGFEIFMEEGDDGRHKEETATWIAAPEGSFEGLDSSLHVEAGRAAADSKATPQFNWSFDEDPSVLATLNTYRNGEFLTDRVWDVTTSGFKAKRLTTCTTSDPETERAGWIAFSMTNSTTDETTHEIGRHHFDDDKDGTNDSAEEISFASFLNKPTVVVQGTENMGGDGAYARGAGTWSASSHSFYAEEGDDDGDCGTHHQDAQFDWAAFGSEGRIFLRKFARPQPGVAVGPEEDMLATADDDSDGVSNAFEARFAVAPSSAV